MTDGFGTGTGYYIQDNAGVVNLIGVVGAVRAGVDNTGDLVFRPATNGVSAERVRVTSTGNLLIGTNIGTVAQLEVNGVIGIDYTANAMPVAVASKVFLFVTNSPTAAELQVEDGSGNVTTLSPHEGTKHMADSFNIWTGKGRKIDLDELAKGVQRLLTIAAKTDASATNGINVSRIFKKTSCKPVSWTENEARKVAEQDAAIAAWRDDPRPKSEKGEKPDRYRPEPKPDWLVEAEAEE
jgi:hypothetical protein